MTKKTCCCLIVFFIWLSNFGVETCWGQTAKQDALSDQKKGDYHKRLAELQKVGEELYHIIINEDIDKLIGLFHEKVRISIGVDERLSKSELEARLRDKNSFEYCHLFDTECFLEKARRYVKEDRGWKSVGDFLKNAKNLKIKVGFRQHSIGEYSLNWGYVDFDWEGKPNNIKFEIFVSPTFVYLDGRWWLASLFYYG